MKIIFWGNGNRGAACLQALYDKGFKIPVVVAHPTGGIVVELAQKLGIDYFIPDNPNAAEFRNKLLVYKAELFVLAGYGKILKQETIDLPNIMTLNLHGGKLPQRRGSSPMNWALLQGEKSFTLSIIKVNTGIDSGDVVNERTFDIALTDTICDLHKRANKEFPKMLVRTIGQIVKGEHVLTPQDNSKSSYYPLRFPDDGFIVWDMDTAQQIYNKVRALTEPYPCTYTVHKGKRIKILSAQICRPDYFGEPGRIYKKSKKGILICASDKCLWITNAIVESTGEEWINVVDLYDEAVTVRKTVFKNVLMRDIR